MLYTSLSGFDALKIIEQLVSGCVGLTMSKTKFFNSLGIELDDERCWDVETVNSIILLVGEDVIKDNTVEVCHDRELTLTASKRFNKRINNIMKARFFSDGMNKKAYILVHGVEWKNGSDTGKWELLRGDNVFKLGTEYKHQNDVGILSVDMDTPIPIKDVI